MTPATTKARRRRLWCVWGLASLLALGLGVTTVFYVLARSAAARWERLAYRLRADDEALTFSEIKALQGGRDDESNGATAIQRAAQELQRVGESDESGVFVLDRRCKADFSEGISRACVNTTRTYVEARKASLDELAKLHESGVPRLNLSYEGTMFDIGLRVTDLSSEIRQLGKLAYLDALLKTIDGDGARTVGAILLQLRLSEALLNEPDLILHLVAIANDTLAVKAAGNLLAMHELPFHDVSRLQREFERQASFRTMKWALLGQRAWFVHMGNVEHVKAETDAVFRRFPVPPGQHWTLPNPINWIPFKDDWWLQRNRLQGVTILTRLVAASDDTSKLLIASKQDLASVPRYSPGSTLLRTVLPSLVRSIELHARSLAFFRCMSVALAAECSRLTVGRFPISIDELVPDYLADLPSDPFNGYSIRLVRTNDGVVVYSVGENLADDGGSVIPQQGERFGDDFGFRVLNPDLRGPKWLDEDLPRDGS